MKRTEQLAEINFGSKVKPFGANIRTLDGCAQVLKSGDDSRKNGLFLEIARVGLELRQTQKAEPQRFTSEGFTRNVAESLGITNEHLLSLLRSFRAEIVLAEEKKYDPAFTGIFCETAEDFLNTMTTPSDSRTSKPLLELNARWDHCTIGDFNRIFASAKSKNTRGTWPPYELETVKAFYERRDVQRFFADHYQLSPLDRLILTETLDLTPERDIAKMITRETGLPYSHLMVTDHKNALVYGEVRNPYRASKQ